MLSAVPLGLGLNPGKYSSEEHSDETHEQCTMVDVRAGVSHIDAPHRTSDVVSGFQNVVDEAPQSMSHPTLAWT
ncbi:hypothetical protein TNCV_153381 [Trichonephila clavipes]|nr:hypothetical protein TNCV_153381 [Trichonephila clavipes]